MSNESPFLVELLRSHPWGPALQVVGFIGLGAPPPTPEWGAILRDGREFLRIAWWISVFPGLAIVFTVVSFNLLGDALRDTLDPRVRRGG